MVYKEEIKALQEILRKKFEDFEAKVLATIFVLAASWGAGDAFAGFLLQRLKQEIIDAFFSVLEKYGIWERPKRVTSFSFWIYVLDVMEHADFGNQEINNAIREYVKVARSGGRYTPSFLKKIKK